MLAGQRESGGVVVECRSGPGCRRVAGLARLREPCVARVLRALIIGQVARGTSGPEPSVFPAYVTAGAGRRRVLAGQREFRGAVVEDGPGPLRRRVTCLAILRESS